MQSDHLDKNLNKKRPYEGIFIHYEKQNRQIKCQLIENIKLFGEGKINHRFTITLMRIDVFWWEVGTRQTVRNEK